MMFGLWLNPSQIHSQTLNGTNSIIHLWMRTILRSVARERVRSEQTQTKELVDRIEREIEGVAEWHQHLMRF